MMKNKSYSELMKLETFEERFDYLKLGGKIGETTFGCDRYLNQILYHDPKWKAVRRRVIKRDSGRHDTFDLGVRGRPILGLVYVHHINPVFKQDIIDRNPCLFDEENLISCSKRTHNAIHYGDESLLDKDPIDRSQYDTCPWKRKENQNG